MHSHNPAQTAQLYFSMCLLSMKTEQRHLLDLQSSLIQRHHLRIFLSLSDRIQPKRHHQTWRYTFKQWILRRRHQEHSALCTRQADQLLISVAPQISTRLDASAVRSPNSYPKMQPLAKTSGTSQKGVPSATWIMDSIHTCMLHRTATFFADADTSPLIRPSRRMTSAVLDQYKSRQQACQVLLRLLVQLVQV